MKAGRPDKSDSQDIKQKKVGFPGSKSHDANLTFRQNAQSAAAGLEVLSHLAEICEKPRQTTETLLQKIMADNAQTEYGRKYGFDQIRTLEEFKAKVPVITYEDIEADMERMKAGAQNVLTAYPYTHMNVTSGTAGKQKAIPLTEPQSRVFMQYSNQLPMGLMAQTLGHGDSESAAGVLNGENQSANVPETESQNSNMPDVRIRNTGGQNIDSELSFADWRMGRCYCTTQGTHTVLPTGVTIGCASSIMADICKGHREPFSSMLEAMYTSPPEAMSPGPGTDSVYMHTRFALQAPDLTGIISGFITPLCTHFKYIHDHYELLIADIEAGTIDPSVEMRQDTRAALQQRIVPMPQRAAQLRQIFRGGPDFPFLPAVWPKMQYYICAGGDGFTVYDRLFERLYAGGALHRIYSGITASEGLWTAPVAMDDPSSVLVPDSAILEFLPVDAGDDFSQTREIDQLEVGKAYELIITNLCGYYRYRMSDAVKVTGFWHKTPLVQFLYRLNKTINLACEKVTELDLRMTAERTASCLGFELLDYEVYPDPSVFPPQYKFLIEAPEDTCRRVPKRVLDRAVLEALCSVSKEFEEVFLAGEIQAPDCWFESPQTQLLYMEKMVYLGANPAQIKPVHVITTEEEKKFFLGMRIIQT